MDHYLSSVLQSIHEISPEDLTAAVAASKVDLEYRDDIFMQVAAAIVEPSMEQNERQDYNLFMDNNVHGWASWIKQCIGDEWGEIAATIAEEGY